MNAEPDVFGPRVTRYISGRGDDNGLMLNENTVVHNCSGAVDALAL